MKTNKSVFRLLAFCLLISVSVTLLSACGKKKPSVILDEAEIKAAAEELIQKSILWNELFYIEGMRPLEGGRTPSDSYVEIDPDYLAEIGFSSIREIKDYGAGIFTPKMTEMHEQTLFGALKSDVGGLISSAACMDYEEKVTGVLPYPVMNPGESPKKSGETPWGEHVSYLYETMRVTYNLNYSATVLIDVVGAEEKNLGKTDTLTVQLKKLNGIWYLDNSTFTKIDG